MSIWSWLKDSLRFWCAFMLLSLTWHTLISEGAYAAAHFCCKPNKCFYERPNQLAKCQLCAVSVTLCYESYLQLVLHRQQSSIEQQQSERHKMDWFSLLIWVCSVRAMIRLKKNNAKKLILSQLYVHVVLFVVECVLFLWYLRLREGANAFNSCRPQKLYFRLVRIATIERDWVAEQLKLTVDMGELSANGKGAKKILNLVKQ